MWIIAWMYNGVYREEKHDSFPDAMARVIQLEAYGMKVSLHTKV